MAKKGVAQKVRLVTDAKNQYGNPTGTTYYVKKGKNAAEKLQFKKYDPEAWDEAAKKKGRHVLFTEKKLPPAKKN